MNEIDVLAGFSGGNPQDPGQVRQRKSGWFEISPECETEETPAYKFRLDVDVVNKGEAERQVTLGIDWAEPHFMHLRRKLYVKGERDNDWRQLSADSVEKTTTTFTLTAGPGTTQVSAQPRYDLHDLEKLSRLCEGHEFVRERLVGQSILEYPIRAYEFMRGKSERRVIVAIGRVHPYESAGSYCIDGCARRLLEDVEFRESLLKHFNVVLIPVLSLGGVMHGHCRLAGKGGELIDISRNWQLGDILSPVMSQYLESLPLAGYMEIHNWMHPHIDGIVYLNLRRKLKTFYLLWRLRAGNKRWSFDLGAGNPRGMKGWARNHMGATVGAFEYPWHNRSTPTMRNLGAKTVYVFARVVRS